MKKVGRIGHTPCHPLFLEDVIETQPALEEESPPGPSWAALGEGAPGGTKPLPVLLTHFGKAQRGGESQRRRRTRAALQRGEGAPGYHPPPPRLSAVTAAAEGDTGEDRPMGWVRESPPRSHSLACPAGVPSGPAGPCPSITSFPGPNPRTPLPVLPLLSRVCLCLIFFLLPLSCPWLLLRCPTVHRPPAPEVWFPPDQPPMVVFSLISASPLAPLTTPQTPQSILVLSFF